MEGQVRIGIVSEVSNGQVRVSFAEIGIISGWLTVLNRKPQVTDTGMTGGGEATLPAHSHTVSAGDWMPSVGDTVLCLYLPGFNADGFVLGGL